MAEIMMRRPVVPRGAGMSMSATSPTPADFRPEAAGAVAWLLGRLQRVQRHRAAEPRRPVRRAVLIAAAAITWLAVTLWNVTREFGAHAAAMGCLVIAGFTVVDTLGWLAAGLAIMWTQHLYRADRGAPPAR